MAESISLNCLIRCDSLPMHIVIVNVALGDTIYQLKYAIKAETGLNHIPTDDFVIQKVSYPEQSICHYCVVTHLQFPDLVSGGDIANSFGKIPGAERLESLKKLSDYFTGPVGQSSFDLVVQVTSHTLSGEYQPFAGSKSHYICPLCATI